MGIEFDPKSVKEVERYLQYFCDVMHEEVVRALSYLGELCVVKIRDRSGAESWFDQTGNLRSSIGYAIFSQGKKVMESAFNKVLNGSEGTIKGRNYINELAGKYQETYALLLVAGMEYADKVEALDNKDVLASTGLWAEKEIERYIQKAIEKATKRVKPI